eukprot:gene5053-8760_t
MTPTTNSCVRNWFFFVSLVLNFVFTSSLHRLYIVFTSSQLRLYI